MVHIRRIATALVTTACVVLSSEIPGALNAQEAKKPARIESFWDSDQRTQAAVAVQMITQSNPFLMAGVRIAAKKLRVWHELNYDPAHGAPELNEHWLAMIKDRTPLPDFRGRDPHSRTKVEVATYDLYCQALIYASFVPLEAFAKSAEDNDKVGFAQLYQSKDESSKYRGKVIFIEGNLRRLRRYDAPVQLLNHPNYAIRNVYEGWIEGPTKNAPLFWVVMPAAPEDKDDPTGELKPAEEMNRPVKFYGYFFKLLPYPVQLGSGENLKTVDRFAPMLIGPPVIVTGPAAKPPADDHPAPAQFSNLLIIILAVFGGFAILVVLLLTWWFYREDQSFRERVRQFHASQAQDALEFKLEDGDIQIEKEAIPVDLEEKTVSDADERTAKGPDSTGQEPRP